MFGAGGGGFGGGGGGLGLFAAKDPAAEAAKRKAVSQVGSWLEQMLPAEERWEELEGGKAPMGKETNVFVNQLACQEEGCPDVEVVITLRRPKPRPRLMFKIYKAAVDLSQEEVEKALEQAMAEERGEHGHGHGHNAPAPEAGGGHAGHGGGGGEGGE